MLGSLPLPPQAASVQVTEDLTSGNPKTLPPAALSLQDSGRDLGRGSVLRSAGLARRVSRLRAQVR